MSHRIQRAPDLFEIGGEDDYHYDADRAADLAAMGMSPLEIARELAPGIPPRHVDNVARALRPVLPIESFCATLLARDDPDDYLTLWLRRDGVQSAFVLRIEHEQDGQPCHTIAESAGPAVAGAPSVAQPREKPANDGASEPYALLLAMSSRCGSGAPPHLLAQDAADHLEHAVFEIRYAVGGVETTDPEYAWAVHHALAPLRRHERDLRESRAAWQDQIRMTTTLESPRIKPYRRGI